MTGDPDDAVMRKQHVVQRKLGRCMLILQQYERLLKSISATHSFAGPIDQIVEIQAKHAAAVQRKTLGQLVGELTDTYIVDSSRDADGYGANPSSASIDGQAWIAMRFHVSMEPERYAQTRGDLEHVVAMRNELIHHFIEKFDLWSEQSCVDAEVHLDECYAEIRSSFMRLRQFAQSTDNHRARARDVFGSPEVLDFIVDGILPDGQGVDWPRSTIVALLREAETKFAQDGWTPLASVIKWIASTDKDQTPKKYGCASWRKVLHRAMLFEVKKVKAEGATASGSPTWYRSRRP